jgi:hypothetical protein
MAALERGRRSALHVWLYAWPSRVAPRVLLLHGPEFNLCRCGSRRFWQQDVASPTADSSTATSSV